MRAARRAEVVVADPRRSAAARAEAMGLPRSTEEQAWHARQGTLASGGSDRGADFVFQTRAPCGSLHTALKRCGRRARVIDLAFYQGGAERCGSGEEFHHNGLTHPLRADQPGAARPGRTAGTAAGWRRDDRPSGARGRRDRAST